MACTQKLFPMAWATLGLALALAAVAPMAQAGPFKVAIPDGFAAGATGGGNLAPITVTTAAAFKTAAVSPKPAVIIVSGKLSVGSVNIASNKTIVGAATDAQLSGNLQVGGSNYIFQNLIVGPSPTDAMEVSRATRVIIHKCAFFDLATYFALRMDRCAKPAPVSALRAFPSPRPPAVKAARYSVTGKRLPR